jgi:DNA-binding response OmpR family regulator
MNNKKPALLIAEDDPLQQELLKIWLEAENYTVITAADGEQTLAKAMEHKPDLILLDLIMPGLNGFEVARRLKENAEMRQIPVVAVTSLEAHHSRIEALEIGVDDFINKPLDRIELLVRVRNLLQSRAYFKQLQEHRGHLLQLESLASVGTLITSVTQEINKPLLALQDIFRDTQIHCADNPQTAALFAQASEQVGHIDLVVHNMGLYIKLISKQPCAASCDVNAIMTQVLEMLGDKMAAAGIQLGTDIAADLPRVACSTEGMTHVLVHLLLNAYDALQDCPQPRIKIGIAPLEGRRLMVSVCDNNADTGGGLYSLVSDPLFSAKLPEACNGLGLALACHFIEASGGSISVDCTDGQGCCIKAVFRAA